MALKVRAQPIVEATIESFFRLLTLSQTRLQLFKLQKSFGERATPSEWLQLANGWPQGRPPERPNQTLTRTRTIISRVARKFVPSPSTVVLQAGKPQNAVLALEEKLGDTAIWLARNTAGSKSEDEEAALGYKRILTQRSVIYYSRRECRGDFLVVGWTGNASRLMMPVAQFLRALAATNGDLLLIRYRRDTGWWTGRAEDSRVDAPASRLIRHVAASQGYDRLSILGTSRGTGPALLSSLHTDCHKVAVVGFNSFVLSNLSIDEKEFSMAMRKKSVETPRFEGYSFTFGAETDLDSRDSVRAAKTVKGSYQRVENAPHNALNYLNKSGKLSDWIGQNLA